MKKIVIVHLSDIHYDDTEKTNDLLKKLVQDLKLMKAEVSQYDLIAITGDCVDRGHVDLFSKFEGKVKLIRKACGLQGKNRSIIVPGNHDVSHTNAWLESIIKSSGNDYEKAYATIEEDFSPLFKEFNDFVYKFSSPKNGVGVKYISVNGLVIRVVLLNSSWSTLIKNRYGELQIGEKQLIELKEAIEGVKKKYDMTIACMHHPLDWFRYEDRVKVSEFLFKTLKIDFLFHGHIHEAGYDSLNNIDGVSNIFCTGMSYTKVGESSSRKDGMRYSIYEIDKDTRTINVYLRATNNKGDFVKDNRLYTRVNEEGFFTIPMGNISECLFPIDKNEKRGKSSIFVNREFVESLIHKEELLFRYYCGMENVLETILSKEEEYTKKWLKSHGGSRKQKDKDICKKEFYMKQFELYCTYALNNLNALFFGNHKDIRFLLRRYDPTSNSHVAVQGEGIYSSTDDIRKVKNFEWGKGMIYNSYKYKAALLKSKNIAYHEEGNSHDLWKDYLTIAIEGVEVRKARELVPIFSLNIATNSLENEKCLQVLAVSSIYEKLQEVFKLFNTKAYSLAKLYDME